MRGEVLIRPHQEPPILDPTVAAPAAFRGNETSRVVFVDGKRGRESFAGTALRVLRTKAPVPFFQKEMRRATP